MLSAMHTALDFFAQPTATARATYFVPFLSLSLCLFVCSSWLFFTFVHFVRMSTEEKERERESKTVPKVSLNQIYSLLSNHTLQSVCVCVWLAAAKWLPMGKRKRLKKSHQKKEGTN